MMRHLIVIAVIALLSTAFPTGVDAASDRVRRATNSTSATNPTASGPNVACNEARLNILLSLIVSEDATDKIVPSELDTATSLAAAQKGFDMANTGIKQIALAITNSQSPPVDSRSLVGGGISIAATALASINGTDAINANLTLANAQLQSAIKAADDVVNNCK